MTEESEDIRRIEWEVRIAAQSAGLTDADMLPVAKPFLKDVKINVDGDIEGVTEAVAAFKKAKPALFGVRPKFDARTATPEEYAAAKQALMNAPRHAARRRHDRDLMERLASKYPNRKENQ